MSSARLLGLDTLWVIRRVVVLGSFGTGIVWMRDRLKGRFLSGVGSRAGNEESDESCDCKPLWTCMTDGNGQDCSQLEADLRACMDRAAATQ
mmetsp:Transcript_10366/g.43169  ORF Transcript_10366/g.43169 Transcript_10366/m.43169 type:complete len:92 (-) Transcript_10366:826-1101(-)